MTIISLIAAMEECNGLGFKNTLPWHLPADLSHFKAITLGKPIIMGRKTFESIGRPLPKRHNIVLTKTIFNAEGISVVTSMDEALSICKGIDEVMIIGGASIYAQSIYRAQRLYLTRIHHHFKSDVYFPLWNPEEWTLISSELRLKDKENSYDMTFEQFNRS